MALIVSSILSAAFGAGLYRLARAEVTRSTPSRDFQLSFEDGHGRPISAQDGPLRLVLDPFTLYRNAPDQRTASYAINQHGFRGPWIESAQEQVFLLGGSTAFGLDLTRDDQTVAGQLENRWPGVTVVNAGVVGYLSGQELALMVHYLDHFTPTGYIVLDGWNELFDQFHFAPRWDGRLGFNNTFFDIENRLHQFHVNQTRIGSLPPRDLPAADRNAYFDTIVDEYVSNVARMHAFATARGAVFLLVPQPELGSKRFPTEEEERALRHYERGYAYRSREFPKHYAELVRRTMKRCRSQGIPAYDLSADARWRDCRQRLYVDAVHWTPAGSSLAAHLIAEECRSLGWQPLAKPGSVSRNEDVGPKRANGLVKNRGGSLE